MNVSQEVALSKKIDLLPETYFAETTTEEKIYRVMNNMIFGVAMYGAYCTFTAQPLGWASQVAITLFSRKITASLFGFLAFPEFVTSIPFIKNELENTSEKRVQKLKDKGFIVRKILLYKSGTSYDATLIGHSSIIDNGKWTINALKGAVETYLKILVKRNLKRGSNSLLINGPSVSGHGGWPTRYQMGAGFEAGLQFLEREIKATCIIMQGHSFHGGMMAEAILQHDFSLGLEKNIQYLSVSTCTFSKFSSVICHDDPILTKLLLSVVDMELDGVQAARKLSDLNISHIIVQHCTKNKNPIGDDDELIADVDSLAYALHQEKGLEKKFFIENNKIVNYGLSEDVEEQLTEAINQCFS